MKKEEVQALIKRAHRSLRSARNLLEDGDYDFAVSRAYYAMFYAASAALLTQNVRRARHSGVIASFGQYLIKTGKLDPELQKSLQGAFEDRSEADYAGLFPSRDEVEHRIEEASDFVEAVSAFLNV